MMKSHMFTSKRIATVALSALTSLLAASAANAQAAWQTETIKGVVFVKPKGPNYTDKIDFAELEAKFPVNREALKSWTGDDIVALRKNADYLDQLYARLTAGPVPTGPYWGRIVFQPEDGMEGIARRFLPIDLLIGPKFELVRKFGEFLWNGKHFYPREGVLRNLISDGVVERGLLRTISWGLFFREPHLENSPRSTVDGKKYIEMFPAKLYCGQSLLDSRRESVIIDYAYGENIDQYNPDVDYLAGREGLAVRDEIRMVRPGLYLGRAYMQRFFGLVFVLENSAEAKRGDATESCWTGTQGR